MALSVEGSKGRRSSDSAGFKSRLVVEFSCRFSPLREVFLQVYRFLVSFAAVFRLVTSRHATLLPTGLRDVTSLKTAAKETNRFPPLLKNRHFKIPIRPGIRKTKKKTTLWMCYLQIIIDLFIIYSLFVYLFVY